MKRSKKNTVVRVLWVIPYFILLIINWLAGLSEEGANWVWRKTRTIENKFRAWIDEKYPVWEEK
ncbi:hypothetical protein [Erwinia phage FBB1]|nr:hypothetical protein [Erwinia phage FBB1]